MSATQTKKIEIIPSATSKINEVDFDNLSFGAVFTDHLFECDFINGEWQTPTVKPYAPFLVDPSTRVFHYGQAIFEVRSLRGTVARRSAYGTAYSPANKYRCAHRRCGGPWPVPARYSQTCLAWFRQRSIQRNSLGFHGGLVPDQPTWLVVEA